MTARRLAVSVIALALFVPTPATAAPPTAADFAADCNADGLVLVSGTQRYRNGAGHLTVDCVVGLDPGATLVLKNVNITGTGNLVAISSPEETTVKVIDSVVDVDGFLEVTAGCCAGDPGVPEDDGTVIIKRSQLEGQAVQLVASFDWPNGRVVVKDSDLTATGSLGIQVRASDLGGVDGLVRVADSTLTSGGDVLIRTGTDGRTVARRDAFTVTGATTITTGAGGTCRSVDNTPAVPCT